MYIVLALLGDTGSGTFRLTAEPDWDAVNGYTF